MKFGKGAVAAAGAGILALLLWLATFAVGMTVDSAPYRKALSESFSITALFQTTLVYTPLNAALLTVLAALVGGCSSYLTTAARKPGPTANASEDDAKRLYFLAEWPVASMIRGFLVYVASIAGIYITTDDPFSAPTPAQYVRVVGLLSFLGFALGYDPTLVDNLLSKVPGLGGGEHKQTPPGD
jgi:hypothetical protein